ncbi:hypothetical protein [Rubidibacter lacunae]|nr:hypothetical protein [Rubidibacter lacunae]
MSYQPFAPRSFSSDAMPDAVPSHSALETSNANSSQALRAELQTLYQQLLELERERDAANESAAHWRNLYSTEAQQRRSEARLAEERIARLQAERDRTAQVGEPSLPDSPAARAAIAAELVELNTLEALRVKLVAVLQERDRLFATLRTEQVNHAKTRDSLTAILGDAIQHFGRQAGKLGMNHLTSSEPLGIDNGP